MGTPNQKAQEYSRNIVGCKDPGRYMPLIFLLNSWGSLFGVPSRVPLLKAQGSVLKKAVHFGIPPPLGPNHPQHVRMHDMIYSGTPKY